MPPSGFDYVRNWDAERAEKGWWHSFELPDGSLIEGVCNLAGLKNRLAQFPIPADLTGKRVLDIGCWDGWFSFEMERRGAEVMAVDCWDNPRFRQMHALYRSRVDYRQLDMYDLTPARVGRFDIVLFMGVLYHLKHPLLALERVCALATDLAAVDSFVLREGQYPAEILRRPILEFFETDEMGGQTDNWFGPSLPALVGMCRVAGFARVELRSVLDFSACVACYRRWEEPEGPGDSPPLHSALHMHNFGLNFRSDQDDYVSIWFDSPLALTVDNVQPEVSGFGARPLSVTELHEHFWQVNFKLPPLTRPGWHEVRVRLAGGPRSNPQSIALDLPLVVGRVRLGKVCDGTTWKPGELDTAKGSAITFWIEGLPENADLNNVTAALGGRKLRMLYLEPPAKKVHTGLLAGLLGTFRGAPARQVNAGLTGEMPAGRAPLVVRVGGKIAGESALEVKR
jgi:tRNA (mo5U34)-methyltransferase